METKDYLTIIIPSLVTLLGFFITFIINQKEHVHNLQKVKSEKQLSDLYGVQKDVFRFIDMLCYSIAYPENKPEGFDELQEKINSLIICSGSEDAVKLIVYVRNLIFSSRDDEINLSSRYLIAAYVLLAMQIKYDTTGIKTSPEVWYVGKFTTQKMLKQGNFYDESKKAINKIVDDLKLNSFMRIDEI